MWWRRREDAIRQQLDDLKDQVDLLRADIMRSHQEQSHALLQYEQRLSEIVQNSKPSHLPTVVSFLFWLISPVYAWSLIQWLLQDGLPETGSGRIMLIMQISVGFFGIAIGLVSQPVTELTMDIDWSAILRFRKRVIAVWCIAFALAPFLGSQVHGTFLEEYALQIAIWLAVLLSFGATFFGIRGYRRVKMGKRPCIESEVLTGMTLQEGDVFLALSFAEVIPLIFFQFVLFPLQ